AQILVSAPIMATDICTVTVNELPYSGDKVKFVKQDLTSEFGMLTPVAGSTFKIEGDNVVMHIIPSMGKKTYGWIHWGTILDAELTQDITIQDDDGLYFDITVPKTMCGKAIPIAPIKVKDGGTSSSQYYLAIPEEDAFAPADYSAVDAALAKVPSDLSVYAEVTVEPLTDAINAVQRDLLIGEQDKVDAMAAAIEAALKGLMQDIDRIPYDGSEVNFTKEDGTQFGMFTPQSGTTISYDDENITIHYVPKNKTVYKALHVGGILDGTLSEDHPFNEDGTMDLVFPIELAGWGIPVAPIKKSDGGTTKDQYFLMIPTEENLVQGVIDAIEDLPPASELTLDDKADVIAARQAYDTLSEEDKAELDPILETQLELAEATIENLESQNTIADLEQQLEEARAELEAAKEQLAKTPGWHKNDDGSWYFCDNKGETVKGWLSDGGKWYFMDKETGIMQTGWVKDGSTWYYMSGSGAMVTGWQKVGDTWYFFKSSGAMAANEWCEGYWLNANGSWTYQPKGSWKKNNQGWWFGDTSGWYAKNTTQKIDGTNYKFNAAGYWVQ
ncbi:MAG: N-acetylmuramoyl-L-alanine amidase family protein, partial [Solobacterium sp.]|nr:N-acetylmuramoyl-L-alanine amidase family protein [Solobacterium sp.]